MDLSVSFTGGEITRNPKLPLCEEKSVNMTPDQIVVSFVALFLLVALLLHILLNWK